MQKKKKLLIFACALGVNRLQSDQHIGIGFNWRLNIVEFRRRSFPNPINIHLIERIACPVDIATNLIFCKIESRQTVHLSAQAHFRIDAKTTNTYNFVEFFFSKTRNTSCRDANDLLCCSISMGFSRVFLFAFNSSVFCIYEHVFAMPTASHDFFAKLNTTE